MTAQQKRRTKPQDDLLPQNVSSLGGVGRIVKPAHASREAVTFFSTSILPSGVFRLQYRRQLVRRTTVPENVDVDMPISVTCSCGARLEIDEKFLGKEIPCPDCQRPLPTKPPATPPPLDLPDHRRVSGLAVLSLALALVGAFTIIGTLAAIVVGILAMQAIIRQPNKLEGIGFARAGIITGAIGTLITVAALLSPTLLGLDAFLREVLMVGRIQYPATTTFQTENNFGRDNIEIKRLSELWGRYISPATQSDKVSSDDLILINTRDDAYIACQHVPAQDAIQDNVPRTKVLERFHKSELLNLLSRLNGKPSEAEGTIIKEEPAQSDHRKKEIILDLRYGRIDRRFLIRYYTANDRVTVLIFVAVARRNQFDHLQEKFHEAFDSVKEKPN